jgi:hypothetical protein
VTLVGPKGKLTEVKVSREALASLTPGQKVTITDKGEIKQ